MRNLIELVHNNVKYQEVMISNTGDCIDISLIEDLRENYLDDGNCLFNAFSTAERLGVKCVEGFVHTMIPNDEKVIRHCWNRIGNLHFDVTKEFIWDGKTEYKELYYFPVGEYDCDDYIKDGKKFLSITPTVAKEIDDRIKNGE